MIRISDSDVQKFEKEHIDKVREIAAECVVLLKSDQTLPLAGAGKLAAYGNGVRKTVRGGTGSGEVNVRHFVNIEEGLTNAGFEITSGAWLDAYDEMMIQTRNTFIQGIRDKAKELELNPVMLGMGATMTEPDYEFPLAAEGNTAIYVLARNSGEGSDRRPEAGDMNLTETEIRDILTLNKQYKTFILILNVGGMVNLDPVLEVKNILLLSQLGTPTGDVLADILLGKSYPSGKLAMTWASIDKYPSTVGFADPDDTYYKEGIYVGYRYFDTVKEIPTFPFGYGLGYTTFMITPKSFMVNTEKTAVTVTVKNTGNYAGKEVIQVYVSAPQGKMGKPYQELKGFGKTKKLQPGEETDIMVTFDTCSLASFDTEKAAYVLEKGSYIIRVGNCSTNTSPCGQMILNADAVTEKVKNICQGWGFDDYDHQNVKSEKLLPDITTVEISAVDIAIKENKYEACLEELENDELVTWKQVADDKKTLDDFVGSLTEKQLAYLTLGRFHEDPSSPESVIGVASQSVAGAAGETTAQLNELGLDTLVMADGPAGIRVSTEYKLVDGKAKGSSNSLESFMEFLDQEQLQMMAQMMQAPSKEELEAPTYYQYCTAMPIGTALAQSWNAEVCEQCGDMVGTEMEMFGIHLWLAPAMNIQRSPLCGRNFEYYSEDPLITGYMAAGITKGVQTHKGCAATVKHFACNNQETNRYTSNSIVSERALREIYLKGFEICMKEAQPHGLMTSYNLINGEHACNSKELLTYVLRDEWGYKGLVMTDWYATQKMLAESTGHENKHPIASAAGCVKAGNDITMPGGPTDMEDILLALEDTTHKYALTKAELQTAAKRVLQAVLKLR